ncbi:MAG: hypothetical protein QW794_07040 [Thermosphaera sp.]
MAESRSAIWSLIEIGAIAGAFMQVSNKIESLASINEKTLKKVGEIKDEVFEVLTAKKMKNVFPNCVGVGSPFIVRDPDTLQPYILFTAWNDREGLRREVWVAEIDEDLETRNFKRIATGALFDVDGLNTVTAFWDDYNEEWVFACTAYGAPKASYGYFIFFDKRWNVKTTQIIDFESTFDSTVWTPPLADAGIGMVPLFNNYLILTAGFDTNRSMWYITDYRLRPLPSPIIGNVEGGTRFHLAPSYFANYRDVHQLFVYNNQLIMLSECVKQTQLWGLEICYGPEKDWGVVGDTPMIGRFHMPSALIFPYVPLDHTFTVANTAQHPHYTALLGRPLLFFITSPTWEAGGARKYAHEIWATNIRPEEAFNPRKNFPLIASGSREPYLVGKLPIPTFGAKTATIYLFNVRAAGTLTIIESSSPYHIWAETDTRCLSDYSISAGSNKIILDYLAPYIALKTNVDMSEWVVVLE